MAHGEGAEPASWTAHATEDHEDTNYDIRDADGGTKAINSLTEGRSASAAELVRRAECYPELLATAKETLIAFENVMPKHLYKNGCFNWETQPDNCPCLAHKIRGVIEAAS